MITSKKTDGTYGEIGFIKAKQEDGSYKDIEYQYDNKGNLIFEKGFTRSKEGVLPLVIDGIGKPLKDYDIYGNTYQSDGVSPDTPQEVVGCGDRTENLYQFPYTENIGVTGSGDNRTVINSSYEKSSIIPILPNTTYHLSGDRSTSADIYGRIVLFSEYPVLGSVSTHFYSYNSTSKPGVSFTTDDNEIFAVVYTDGADYQTNYNMQLNLGTEATSYEPYGYKLDVVTRGKNLWKTLPSKVTSGVTITHDGEKYIFSGTCETSVNIILSIELNAGIYTLQANANRIPIENTYSCVDIWIPSLSKLYSIENSVATYKTLTFSIDAPVTGSLRIRLEKGVNYDGFELKPMLELGTEATEYSPYVEPITTPIYLDSPLYKIGDYSDSRGMTEEVRVIKELVLTGEENWGNNYNGYTLSTAKKQGLYTVICSHYAPSAVMKEDKTVYTNSTNVLIFYDSSFATVEAWKSYLATQYAAGTPVIVYYVLAEPEVTSVEPVEIPTLNGTTVIDVDTEVKPSNMWVEYKSSTSEYNPVALRTADNQALYTADNEILQTRR